MLKDHGFTLIELTIVVAIVGILAAISIPFYQSYVIRAKLSEPFEVIASAKPSILEYYANEGIMPSTNSPLMATLRNNLTGLPSVISATSSSSPGTLNEVTLGVTITNMGSSTGNTATNSIFFKFIGSSTGLTVDCSATAGTTIEDRYLPHICRN